MKITYNISFNDQVKELGDKFSKEVLARSMIQMQNLAKLYAPVDTGNLRNSIQLEVITDTEIYITSFASYSYWVEYGVLSKPNYPIQPYMRPALDEIRFKELDKIAQRVIETL